jgi:Uma2 family endonuclease
MMVAMTAPEATSEISNDVLGLWPLIGQPITVDDLARMQMPEIYRYELDEGVLVVYGAPSILHQIALSKLTAFLSNACPREFLVIAGPGIAISPIQFRIPDLTVIRSDTIDVRAQNHPHPPALAIEIASPSTSRYDQTRKKQVYAEFGIPDYWIITPDEDKPDITVFRLTRKQYEQLDHVAGNQKFTATRPFPVSFTPAELVSTGQP